MTPQNHPLDLLKTQNYFLGMPPSNDCQSVDAPPPIHSGSQAAKRQHPGLLLPPLTGKPPQGSRKIPISYPAISTYSAAMPL